MKRLLLYVFISCIFLNQAQSQTKVVQNNKASFYSTNQVALLEGNAGSFLAVQSVNGIQFRGWGIGAGAGIDWYQQRTIPLFLHLRRQIPFTNRPFYIYADGGKNYAWEKEKLNMFFMHPKSTNGMYWDAGFQYQWNVGKYNAFVFSLGYSEKTYGETASEVLPCLVPPCPEVKREWDYKFRRIALKAGWKL